SLRPVDSLQLGALYRREERVYFWVILPVVARGKAIGYLAQERRIAVNPQTEQTIRELSGDSAVGYYHNVDGTVWTRCGGSGAGAPDSVVGSPDGRGRSEVGRLITAEERIAGTPVVITMEVPRRLVVATAMATVKRLAAFSVVLAGVGALVAWWAGRR